MEIRRARLGENYPDTLYSMSCLAATCWHQGRLKGTEELLLKVLDIYETLDDECPKAQVALANLAATYKIQGRWVEGENVLQQQTEKSKNKLGNDHRNTIMMRASLISSLAHQGQWERARQLLIETIEAERRQLSDNNRNVLIMMEILAYIS